MAERLDTLLKDLEKLRKKVAKMYNIDLNQTEVEFYIFRCPEAYNETVEADWPVAGRGMVTDVIWRTNSLDTRAREKVVIYGKANSDDSVPTDPNFR